MRPNIAEAMEVKQPAARWALSIRTQVSCLAFLLPRWPLSLVRPEEQSKGRENNSITLFESFLGNEGEGFQLPLTPHF